MGMFKIGAMDKTTKFAFVLFLLFLVVGLGLRLVDLTDPPFDFHPTRQFRGALIARSLYYEFFVPDGSPQQEAAIALGKGFEEFEPPVLEFITAAVYWITGGEKLWVARIFSSLFWVVGGAGLFWFTRRAVGKEAALAALFYYLFLPFSVEASRSFQPDPFMTMWVVLAMLAAYRWAEGQEWKWALLTALFSGLAVLVKVVAAFLIGGMMIALVVPALIKKERIDIRQVLAMAAGMIVLPAVYYLIQAQDSASNYVQNWVIALLPLLKQKVFWLGWYQRLKNLLLIPAVVGALAGIFFAKPVLRRMLVGLWLGYFLYGLSLPHQISTHSYYHIQLIPIVALSIAPLVQWGYRLVVGERRVLAYLAYAGLLLAPVVPVWLISQNLIEEDYRHEPPYWETVGAAVPEDGDSIALVQYYGYLVMYYGEEQIAVWPDSAEQRLAELRGSGQDDDFEAYFQKLVEGKTYFMVINMRDFKRQKNLNEYLTGTYPVYEEGSGYLIFDLTNPIE